MKTPLLFSYAFRPFFLISGIFAVIIMLFWLLNLHGANPVGISPLWHAHEMLVGFALAAVAGFSLTAVANWTGRPAVHGLPLGLLILSWLLGRIAMLLHGSLSIEWIAVLDSLFPVLLTVLLGREVIGGHSRRNYQLVAVLGFISLANLAYHLGPGLAWANAERTTIYLVIHAILLLVIIIAGRIIPNFSTNWLHRQGHKQMPVNTQWVNQATLTLSVLAGLAMSFFPLQWFSGMLAFAAALLHAYRLSRWQGLATRTNPLLFILHVAYAWIPIGYTLTGLAVFGWLFPASAALHALTMGAIGGIILAVSTRVGLGHTGRPLLASRATVVAYWVFMLAVLVRIGASLTGAHYLHTLDLAATGWMLAFGIFLWVYWPMLTHQRKR